MPAKRAESDSKKMMSLDNNLNRRLIAVSLLVRRTQKSLLEEGLEIALERALQTLSADKRAAAEILFRDLKGGGEE